MSIQSTINQGLSLAGLLVSQSPLAAITKEKREFRNLQKNLETAENVTETAQITVEDIEKLPTENERREAESSYSTALEREADIQEEIYRRSPTQERLQGIIKTRSARTEFDEAVRKARERLEQENERLETSNAVTAPFNPTLDTIVRGGQFDGRKK